MKKALVFLTLIVAVLMCFVACNKEQPQNPTPEHTHNFGEWSITKNATCTEDGVKTRYCNCGEKQSDTVPAIAHKEQIIPAKESTCTEKGLTEGKKCSACGEVLVAQQEKPLKAHTEEIIPAVESTCTEMGLTEGKKCSACGEVLVAQQETPLKAHSEEIIPAVESTCTEKGLTEGKKCSICGEILIAQQETPIIAHTYDNKYDDECNVCGHKRDVECAHLETEVIPGKAATCTATGVTDGEKCKKCGEILTSQTVIGVKPHTEVIDNAIAATCTSTGLTEGKHCAMCNEVLVAQETTPIVDHNFVGGYCAECGAKKISEGLEFTLNGDGVSYSVTGIGTCTDTDIFIPSTHNDLPVTAIGDNAFYNCNSITSISIPNSVKTIGEWVFYYCYNLTSVTIPDSVTIIGDNAFYFCYGITSLTLGNGVKSIGWGAFYNCSSIEIIDIPNSVTTIGDRAFVYCYDLVSVTIGSGVVSIGEGAFYSCWKSLTTFTVHDDNNHYKSIDGNLYTKDGKTLIQYAIGRTDSSFALPVGVTNISSYAFSSCYNVKNIAISNTLTSIGYRAFEYCTSLISFTFDGTIQQWMDISKGIAWDEGTSDYTIYCTDGEIAKDGTVTYYEVASKGLEFILNDDGKSYSVKGVGTCTDTHIVIPDAYNNLPVTSIGAYAFEGCINLIGVNIPASVNEIGVCTFYDCTSLETITFDDECVITLFPGSMVNNCVSLKSIEIPSTVSEIDCSFDCPNLKNVYFKGTLEKWCGIKFGLEYGSYSYNPCSSGADLYINGEKLVDIVIPETLTSIGFKTFAGCSSLESVIIPKSINSIGHEAFYDCKSLTNVYYGGDINDWINIDFASGSSNPLYNGADLFVNNELVTNIIIPTNGIGDYSFVGCKSITSVTIPEDTTNIGSGVFERCAFIKDVHYMGDVEGLLDIYYNILMSGLFDLSSTEVSEGVNLYLDDELVVDLIIPNTITSISGYAFAGVGSLKSVKIPNSVSNIGMMAFSLCVSLENIYIGSSVNNIGDYAFAMCSSLTNIDVDENNKYYQSIDGNLYTKSNKSLIQYSLGKKTTVLDIPQGVVGIKPYAFLGCDCLETINLPATLRNVTAESFYACTSLKNINVDKNSTYYVSIDGNLYSKDKKTLVQYAIGKEEESFVIPNTVTTIGEYAFSGCTTLTTVIIGDSIETIEGHSFGGCTGLERIIIPNSVKKIGEYAFSNSPKLTIYCVAESKPQDWLYSWYDPHYDDNSTINVVWGYTGE